MAVAHNPRLLERLILWPPAIERKTQYDRLLTHGFIHADFQHLLFNMITLYFFGRLVEQVFVPRVGHLGFVLFYLSAIVVAILPTYAQHRHDANYRSLGASGAVSAVLFAFILMQPWSMIFVFFLPMPAIVYAVLYVGYSIWKDHHGGDNINHVGLASLGVLLHAAAGAEGVAGLPPGVAAPVELDHLQ